LSLGPAGERQRGRLLSPLPFFLWMCRALPLAAFAGLRIVDLDDRRCAVRLPGGWRTKNPFRSTYFAAQAMAAELSSGAPAAVLLADAGASISMLPLALRVRYVKKLVGAGTFTFEDVAGMGAVVELSAASDEPRAFTARPVGRDAAGEVVSEFEIDWSFKRRNRG
jgi:hypothetical protein